jgi:ubiquitin carboxyl-terminal hydrolase 14
LVLDVFDFCTEELRDKLKGPRKVYQETEDAKVGLKKKEKEGAEGVKALQNLGTSTSDENVEMVDDAGRHPSSSEKVCAPEPEVTGIYDLVAVLTHKGRSADSGHYVAWVKQDSGKWIEFDDEQPILQKEEDITKLSGGGDWHMAYICLYKARVALPH